MKSLLITLLTLSGFSLTAQDSTLDRLYQKDIKKINELDSDYNFIAPLDYEEDLNVLADIIKEIQDSTESKHITQVKLNLYKNESIIFNKFHGKLSHLKKLWNESLRQLDHIRLLKEKIDSSIMTGNIKSKKQYLEYKKHLEFKSALDAFRKSMKTIKRKEKNLFTSVAIFYGKQTLFNWKNRAPFYHFTRYFRERLTKNLVKLNKDLVKLNKNLVKLNKDLDDMTLVRKLTQDTLVALIKKQEELKDSIDNRMLNFDAICSRSQYEADSLKLLSQSAASELDSILRIKSILELEIGIRERKISSLSNTLKNLYEQVTELKHSEYDLSNQNSQLKIQNDTLRSNNKQLEVDNKALGAETNFINSILLILVMLFFIGLIILLTNRSRIIKARKKLALTNLELENAREELHLRTQELEFSYKELNHRIKNNLQQVSSLIYLQAGEISDEKTREMFHSLQGRIDTIKIIHQKLYTGRLQNMTTVNIADYIKELANYIVGGSAKMRLDLEPINIEMDHALYIGLIINELVTNASKYAFPRTDDPELKIRIRQSNELLNIEVQDNGPGFEDFFSLKNLSSFGLKSVDMIVKSKSPNGKFQILNRGGAFVKIQIPFNQNKNRLIT